MVSKNFLVAGILFLTLVGCASTTTSSNRAQPYVIDPVCAYFSDMGCIHITVDEDTPKSLYEGVTYYFCHQECKNDFDKNPSKFLKVTPPPEEAIDLVCRMKIDNVKRYVTCVYHDKIYYFCSDYCRIKYMADPGRYGE
jgi:YHS domain-containing protein